MVEGSAARTQSVQSDLNLRRNPSFRLVRLSTVPEKRMEGLHCSSSLLQMEVMRRDRPRRPTMEEEVGRERVFLEISGRRRGWGRGRGQ